MVLLGIAEPGKTRQAQQVMGCRCTYFVTTSNVRSVGHIFSILGSFRGREGCGGLFSGNMHGWARLPWNNVVLEDLLLVT